MKENKMSFVKIITAITIIGCAVTLICAVAAGIVNLIYNAKVTELLSSENLAQDSLTAYENIEALLHKSAQLFMPLSVFTAVTSVTSQSKELFDGKSAKALYCRVLLISAVTVVAVCVLLIPININSYLGTGAVYYDAAVILVRTAVILAVDAVILTVKYKKRG